MSEARADILLISYNRPVYTEKTLERLVETCSERDRVWIWHNGEDEETLAVVRAFEDHPRVHRFHHSPVNEKLHKPTNWLWENADAPLLGKVDDDCLMPDGWIDRLAAAHEADATLGVIGCWVYTADDFDESLAAWKIRDHHGHRIMRNCWMQGSGYLMKRECVDQLGMLSPEVSYTMYCKRLAARGWAHGWLLPLLLMDHMDDPRSPHTLMKSKGDFDRYQPLSAVRFGAMDVEARIEQIRSFAREVHTASIDPRQYVGWRPWVKRALKRFSGSNAPAGVTPTTASIQRSPETSSKRAAG